MVGDNSEARRQCVRLPHQILYGTQIIWERFERSVSDSHSEISIPDHGEEVDR